MMKCSRRSDQFF